ncbi:uncharacterized protein BX664DRAFT_291894 [Halteromyces radiatus]|uniref:uncharacterized protein n=1 Tax=Halteromyces radiatus TaxID=101107 RepID=UPI00221F6A53|nr:uncharacterized protein BX664DRAFT_291894 [Halteromyces radiatus]KAI8096777.1 hypothetical protein BX664DRAFT_291894 [Halteromyces radiatus]
MTTVKHYMATTIQVEDNTQHMTNNEEQDSIINDQYKNEDNKKNGNTHSALFPTPQDRRKFLIKQLRAFALMMLIDVGLPLAIYYVLKMYVSMVVALVLSGLPPLIKVIVKFIRKRKVDALGCIFVFSYVLSGILSLISGDARLALLRDSTVTCVIASVFLITLVPLNTRWIVVRPLTYLLGQSMISELPPIRWTDKDGMKQEQPLFEFLWSHVLVFRIHNYVLTSLWGICLMGEFIAKLLMIRSSMSVDDIVWVSTVIVIVVVVVLSVISTIGSGIIRRRAQRIVPEWRKQNDFTDLYETSDDSSPGKGQNSMKKTTTNESVAKLV